MTDDGEEWLRFADVPGGFLLTFPEHGAFEVSADASRVVVRPLPGTPPETTRHLLLNQILPLVISRRGRLVFHASAVSYDDRVSAFIGRSGAGKSTLAVACAHAGAAIVSDDCLVVYPDAGRWMAVPCHAGVRLWPRALSLLGRGVSSGEAAAHYSDKRRLGAGDEGLVFESRHLPLIGIQHLQWAPARTLRGRDAVMALASEVFRLDWRDAAESRRHFDVLAAIARDIPVEIPERQAPELAAQDLLCRMRGRWRLP